MSNSTKWILMGALTVMFGIIVLGNTAVASVAVTVMAGVMLLIGGGLQIVGGFSIDETWGKIFAIVMGVIMVMLGWSLLAHPLQGVISLSLAILILLIAGGIARIFVSFRMSGTGFFWPMILSGVLSLVLAAIIWSNTKEDPASLFNLLGLLMGIEMLLDGLGLIFLGLFAKKNGEEAARNV
ncbi:MAG: HdeD family acid-resistance protein [Paracoccaceae bacterium]|jgi:uncharacterized membrane protein HdeD (DUF308 family)